MPFEQLSGIDREHFFAVVRDNAENNHFPGNACIFCRHSLGHLLNMDPEFLCRLEKAGILDRDNSSGYTTYWTYTEEGNQWRRLALL